MCRWQVRLCDPSLTSAILESLSDESIMIKHCANLRLPDFTLCIGFTSARTVTLTNTSDVPLSFHAHVPDDGSGPSVCFDQLATTVHSSYEDSPVHDEEEQPGPGNHHHHHCRLLIRLTCTTWFTWTYGNATHTHTHLTALCPGLPGWAGTRKGKPIWILLKQETVSGSGISWAVCKSAPRSRQPRHDSTPPLSFFTGYALPAAQPTASKHCRHWECKTQYNKFVFSCLLTLTKYADSVALLAVAGRTPLLQQSIEVCCLSGPQHLQQWVCCCGPMLGQTHGWTPYRFIDPDLHSMRALPKKTQFTDNVSE